MHVQLFTKWKKSSVEINSFNKLRLIYVQYVPNASSDNYKILLIYLKVRNICLASWKYDIDVGRQDFSWKSKVKLSYFALITLYIEI